MEARVRVFDWSRTPIGAPEEWSPALRATVRIVLANRFPMLLWWGPDYICIYNDAYRSILGRKHPWALGQPVRNVWSEVWHILQPLIDTPFHGGPATWNEDHEFPLNRSGFVEETHFTIAYSPVPDETASGGIGGVLATVHEITEKVVGQRRVTILRDLGTRSSDAKTPEEACATAAETLVSHPKDVPFALLYLTDDSGKQCRLAASAGMAPDADMRVETIALDDANAAWPLGVAQASGELMVVENLGGRFTHLPLGPWSDPPLTAAILPIRSGGGPGRGFLVAGISPRLTLDGSYRDFLELATSQIATAIANAEAYEYERLRAEALAKLDHAKTAFFSNVSHEFRTPLTLMLGPLEQLLKNRDALSDIQQERLTVAHRNGERLLRLVNSLLDFSRIEAGRLTASFEPVDLSALTASLASNFRSVMEAAGLDLQIDCEPLSDPVYVDRTSWEKIVLNLLSNAFKFTFEGRVTVRVASDGDQAILSVSDTGTGIPAAELPHIFERFHRVEGARGRSYEGSGIGLALIQELAKIHGGTVRVDSRVGEGSTFCVSLPFGNAHLPEDQLRAKSSASLAHADGFLQEAGTWLDPARERPVPKRPEEAPRSSRPRILLADDNADMRDYVASILGDDYDVVPVRDGEAALKAARELSPDLILSDVMMPGLDGFGLLAEVRSDPQIRDTPVIMLSARAGEEARVDGISRGADDYVTKPFGARELTSRVRTTLNLQSMRRASEAERAIHAGQFETLLNQAPLGVYVVDADFRVLHANPTARAVFSKVPELIGNDFDQVLRALSPRDYADEVSNIFRYTLETGEPYVVPERSTRRFGAQGQKYFEWRVDRMLLADGRYGVVCYFHDISALVLARQKIAASEERLALAVEGSGMGTWDVDLVKGDSVWSPQHFAMLGYPYAPEGTASMEMWQARVHPEDLDLVNRRIQQALVTGCRYASEHRIVRADTGETYWLSEFGQVVTNEARIPVRFVGISFDITARKRAELELVSTAERLRRANSDLEQFAFSASHDLQEPLRGVRVYSELLGLRLADQLPEGARECLTQVSESAERMEILLRDLSTYIEAWGIERNFTKSVETEVCLNAALANCATAIKEAGAQVEHGPLPSLHVDPTRLQQIFQNLIANALKYRRSDAVPLIRIRAERQDDMWRFAVQDNGIGIAPPFHAQIFGLFKRLHSRQRYPGTGVGLALCGRIVEQYQGRIWVESQLGEGSTFYFTLPA